MSEQHQQPHVEILSRNHRSTIIVAVIPTAVFTGFTVIVLWPFHELIGIGLLVILSIGAACGTAYLLARGYLNLRRQWFHDRIIALVNEYGVMDAASMIHHPVKYLSAPGQESPMMSEKDREVIERSKVLALRFEEGMGMHAIERELGIPYNKVRDWCNAAEVLRKQQQQDE